MGCAHSSLGNSLVPGGVGFAKLFHALSIIKLCFMLIAIYTQMYSYWCY